MPSIVQINVKPKDRNGIGLPKLAVNNALVSKNNVGTDHNYYRSEQKNSSRDRAVLLHSIEIFRELEKDGWPVKPGDLGENITMIGIDYFELRIGSKLLIGDVELEITEVCNPCKVLENLPYVGKERIKEFIIAMKGRRGWYSKVLQEGNIKKGDQIKLLMENTI